MAAADDFDPKAYLAAKTGKSADDFDPSAYLKAKGVDAPVAKKQEQQVSALETYINRAVDALPAGRPIANTIATGIAGLLRPSPVQLGKTSLDAGLRQSATPSVLDQYRNLRDTMAERDELGAAQNPLAAGLGTGTGIGLSLLAPLPKATVGTGALGRLASTGLTATGYGALNALTNGRADLTRGQLSQALTDLSGKEGFQQAKEDYANGSYGQSLLDIAGSGVPGALLTAGGIHAAAPVVSRVAGGAAGGLARLLVRPTDDAQELMRRGVPLTLGQMNPEGTFNNIEHAGDHVVGAGPMLQAQRDAALRQWQQLGMREGVAPAQPPPTPGHNLNAQLDEMAKGFNRNYSSILKGVPASAVGEYGGKAMPLHEAMMHAAADTAAPYDDSDLSAVNRYIGTQATKALTTLDKGQPVTAETLHSIRSDIRDAIKATADSNPVRASMLRNAADVVTDSLEKQLPPEQAAQLSTTDSAYRNYATLRDVLNKAKDSPHGFTTKQFETAVANSASSKSSYARGGGGDMRDISRLGRSVFDAPLPPTGAKALVAGPAIYGLAPLAAAANSSTAIKNALMQSAGAPSAAAGPVQTAAATAHALALAAALRRQPRSLGDLVQLGDNQQ